MIEYSHGFQPVERELSQRQVPAGRYNKGFKLNYNLGIGIKKGWLSMSIFGQFLQGIQPELLINTIAFLIHLEMYLG